jgi:hypothetical protein
LFLYVTQFSFISYIVFKEDFTMARNRLLIRRCCTNQNPVIQITPVPNAVSDLSCGFGGTTSSFPTNYVYGQSYVPYQTMNSLLDPCAAANAGTIFPELVMPYAPCQSIAENAYLESFDIKEVQTCTTNL